MSYPTMQQVEQASHHQLAKWMRFLPSAEPENQDTQTKIYDRFDEFGGWNPALSKQVGWD